MDSCHDTVEIDARRLSHALAGRHEIGRYLDKPQQMSGSPFDTFADDRSGHAVSNQHTSWREPT